jgi:hypothetical protein
MASARIAARLTGCGLDRLPLRLDSEVHPLPVKRNDTLNGAGAPADRPRRAGVFLAAGGGVGAGPAATSVGSVG